MAILLGWESGLARNVAANALELGERIIGVRLIICSSELSSNMPGKKVFFWPEVTSGEWVTPEVELASLQKNRKSEKKLSGF
jgi:hypothetical protein